MYLFLIEVTRYRYGRSLDTANWIRFSRRSERIDVLLAVHDGRLKPAYLNGKYSRASIIISTNV